VISIQWNNMYSDSFNDSWTVVSPIYLHACCVVYKFNVFQKMNIGWKFRKEFGPLWSRVRCAVYLCPYCFAVYFFCCVFLTLYYKVTNTCGWSVDFSRQFPPVFSVFRPSFYWGYQLCKKNIVRVSDSGCHCNSWILFVIGYSSYFIVNYYNSSTQ